MDEEKKANPKRSAAMKRAWKRRRANAKANGTTNGKAHTRRADLEEEIRVAHRVVDMLRGLPLASKEAILGYVAKR